MKNYKEYLNESNPQVRLLISKNSSEPLGAIDIELFPSVAPITVENFLKLVKEDFYSDIIFHRVIKGFVIQGGDPTGTGYSGSSEKIKGEFKSNGVENELSHTRGVISMARTPNPNSASSQFFIMHKDSLFLDGDYAAFGVVVNGLDIVDKIANAQTGMNDKPINDYVIVKASVIR